MVDRCSSCLKSHTARRWPTILEAPLSISVASRLNHRGRHRIGLPSPTVAQLSGQTFVHRLASPRAPRSRRTSCSSTPFQRRRTAWVSHAVIHRGLISTDRLYSRTQRFQVTVIRIDHSGRACWSLGAPAPVQLQPRAARVYWPVCCARSDSHRRRSFLEAVSVCSTGESLGSCRPAKGAGQLAWKC